MTKPHYTFSKENFILLAISIIIIIIGFVLVSGGKSSEEKGFDPSIFSARRLLVAPIVLLCGFGLVFYAILKRPRDNT